MWQNSLWVKCKIVELFVNSFTADNKYSVHNRDIEKNILETKDSILNIFKKRWPLSLMYFRTYGLRKTCLEKWVKSHILQDPSTSNTVNGPKHCWKLLKTTEPLPYLLIPLKDIQVEEVSLSDIQNLRTFC